MHQNIDFKRSFFIFLALFSASVATSSHWNYGNFDDWGHVSETCLDGIRQSPINLEFADTELINLEHRVLNISRYNTKMQASFSNNGHTVVLTLDSSKKQPIISGPAVNNNIYALKNAHWHWGLDNENGTEHSLNGQKYAAELHLVHYNVAYGSFEAAASEKDGLAVIGVVYHVDESATPSEGSLYLFDLLAYTPVRHPRAKYNLGQIDVKPLKPKLSRLVAYDGSLTTPPCTENVRWIVQVEPEIISLQTMKKLRKISLNHNDKENFRPLQNINDRSPEYYKNRIG